MFGVSQWYQWYTNIVQGFTNGTIGNTVCTNGNANGTIGSSNGKLVKLPMVPLGEPEQSPTLQQLVLNLMLLTFHAPAMHCIKV